MKWSKFKTGIPVITLLLTLIWRVSFANLVGTTGASFLKIGIGARPTSMGNAFIAQENDLNAFHWNPAGLFALDDRNIEYSHIEWFQGIRYESVRYVQPYTDKINLGGSLDFLYTGTIEGMSVNQYGVPTTPLNFSASDLMLNLSVSYKYRENLINGWNLKLFRESIYRFSGYGIALDIGWLLYVDDGTWLKELKLPHWLKWSRLNALYKIYPEKAGFVIKNLGTMTALDKQSFPLPTSLGLGITREFFKDRPEHSLIYNFDINIPYYKAMNFNLGFEYVYNNLLFVRTGFKSGAKLGFLSKLSFGFGLYFRNYKDLKFDYAFSSYGDLGLTHQISLTMKVGEYKKELLRGKKRLTRAQRLEQKYNDFITQAKKYEDEGNLKSAAKYYEKAVKIKPSNDIYKKIAELYKALGEEKKYKKYMALAGEEVKEEVKELVPEEKEEVKSIDELIAAAQEAEANGDIDTAIKLIKEALQLEDRADLHTKLGDLYMLIGNIEEASAEYDLAEKAMPPKKVEEPETAPAEKKDVDAMIKEAEQREAAGDIEGAIKILEEALTVEERAEIYQKLGDLYLQIGDAEKASEFYDKAERAKTTAEAVPETTVVAPEITAPSITGEAQEARYKELFEQAQKAYEAGDYQNAVSLANEALKIKETPELQELLGNIYIGLGDVEKATEAYDRATTLKETPLVQEERETLPAAGLPQSPVAIKNVRIKNLIDQAHEAQNNGELDKAVELLNEAIKLEDSAELHELLGNIYIQMGDADKAAKEFEQANALRKRKESSEATEEESQKKQQIENLVSKADEALNNQDYNTAIDYIKKALAIEDLPKLHEKLGNIYLEMGDSDNAALEFEKALK